MKKKNNSLQKIFSLICYNETTQQMFIELLENIVCPTKFQKYVNITHYFLFLIRIK